MMHTCAVPSSRWSASALTNTAESFSGELKALGAHVSQCRRQRGGLFALYCAAEAVDAFVAPRLVTTLVAAIAVFGLSSILF